MLCGATARRWLELAVLAGHRVVILFLLLLFVLAVGVQCVVWVFLEFSVLRGGRTLGTGRSESAFFSFV